MGSGKGGTRTMNSLKRGLALELKKIKREGGTFLPPSYRAGGGGGGPLQVGLDKCVGGAPCPGFRRYWRC